MRHSLHNYLIAFSCLRLTTFTNAQSQKVMVTQQEQAVLQTIEDMTTAFHNKDIERVMASYEPNSLVVFEPESPIYDNEQLKQAFLQAFAVNPRFTYSGHEVFVNGNMATHFAPWVMTGTAPDGTKIEQSGLSVSILRKQADGKWLLIFDNPHGNFLLNKKE